MYGWKSRDNGPLLFVYMYYLSHRNLSIICEWPGWMNGHQLLDFSIVCSSVSDKIGNLKTDF